MALDNSLHNYPLKKIIEDARGRAVDRTIVVALEDRATRASIIQIRELIRIAEHLRETTQAPKMFREALPVLARALAFRGGEWSVRHATVQALGMIWGNDEIIPTLEFILKNDRTVMVRVAAAEQIADIGGAEGIQVLVNALGTKDDDVRRIAVAALESRPNRRFTIPICQNALGHPDPLVRRGAAVVLDHCEWTPPSDDVRAWYMVAKQQWDAVQELEELAVRPLVSVIKGQDARIRAKGAQALDQLNWEPENYAMRGWYSVARQNWDEAKRLKMSATVALVNALEGEDQDIRKSAADALLELRADSVLALVSVLRESRDLPVLQAAAVVLGKIARSISSKGEGPEPALFIDAIPALTAAIQDGHRKVILEPAHALGDIAVHMFDGTQIEGLFEDTLIALREIAREQHTVIRQDLDAVYLRIMQALTKDEDKASSTYVSLFRFRRTRK